MTLPGIGNPISASQIADELALPHTQISLGDSRVRSLAERLSGSISMGDLRGKSAWTVSINPPFFSATNKLSATSTFTVSVSANAGTVTAYNWGVLSSSDPYAGSGVVINGGSSATATLRAQAQPGSFVTVIFYCDVTTTQGTKRATCEVTHTNTSVGN